MGPHAMGPRGFARRNGTPFARAGARGQPIATAPPRSYAQALGFSQWLVIHRDGRRAHVIADSELMAALEANWQPQACALIERMPGARE